MTEENKDGFKMPEAYFDSLYERVSDKLENEPKVKGMEVPTSYFDSVQERVLATVESSPLQVIHRKSTMHRWSLAVASLLAVVFTVVAVWPAASDSHSSIQITGVDLDTFLEHEDMAQELSIEQLAMLMDEEDMEAIATDLLLDDVPASILEDADLDELDDLF